MHGKMSHFSNGYFWLAFGEQKSLSVINDLSVGTGASRVTILGDHTLFFHMAGGVVPVC